MILALLLGLILQETGSEPAAKPVVDNERVAVFEVTTAGPQPLDAVVISFSGKAWFVAKGTAPKLNGRSLLIDLKNHPAPQYANTSGYPLAFPRRGSTKLLENDRVVVWDYAWKSGVPTPMHFHDKDVVVLFLENGELKSTTPDGKDTTTSYGAGTVRYNQGNRAHSETLVKGKQHAIITELK